MTCEEKAEGTGSVQSRKEETEGAHDNSFPV